MAYSINRKSDSASGFNVGDGQLRDDYFSIKLIGKGFTNYGEIIQENILHVMENFADAISPPNPTPGQLWFDVNNNLLWVWTESNGWVDLQQPLNGRIYNQHINTDAKIAISKLAPTQPGKIIVGDSNASAIPTYVDMTGDVLISALGVTKIQSNTVNTTELGSVIDQDMTFGSVSTASNRSVNVLSHDAYVSDVNIHGQSQGSGRLFVGESINIGGGIQYNGDNTPVMSGSVDHIAFYRRDAGIDYEVFKYGFDSDLVVFNGEIQSPRFRVDDGFTYLENNYLHLQGTGDTGIELRSEDGGLPYIDFSTTLASGDYGIRLQATDDDNLVIYGANLKIGTQTQSQDTTLGVYAGNNNIATIEAYGSSQGTGVLYVGKDQTYGGGIVYNGDDNPDLIHTVNSISFYRRNAGTDVEVFSYGYNSSHVKFYGSTESPQYYITGGSSTRLQLGSSNTIRLQNTVGYVDIGNRGGNTWTYYETNASTGHYFGASIVRADTGFYVGNNGSSFSATASGITTSGTVSVGASASVTSDIHVGGSAIISGDASISGDMSLTGTINGIYTADIDLAYLYVVAGESLSPGKAIMVNSSNEAIMVNPGSPIIDDGVTDLANLPTDMVPALTIPLDSGVRSLILYRDINSNASMKAQVVQYNSDGTVTRGAVVSGLSFSYSAYYDSRIIYETFGNFIYIINSNANTYSNIIKISVSGFTITTHGILTSLYQSGYIWTTAYPIAEDKFLLGGPYNTTSIRCGIGDINFTTGVLTLNSIDYRRLNSVGTVSAYLGGTYTFAYATIGTAIEPHKIYEINGYYVFAYMTVNVNSPTSDTMRLTYASIDSFDGSKYYLTLSENYNYYTGLSCILPTASTDKLIYANMSNSTTVRFFMLTMQSSIEQTHTNPVVTNWYSSDIGLGSMTFNDDNRIAITSSGGYVIAANTTYNAYGNNAHTPVILISKLDQTYNDYYILENGDQYVTGPNMPNTRDFSLVSLKYNLESDDRATVTHVYRNYETAAPTRYDIGISVFEIGDLSSDVSGIATTTVTAGQEVRMLKPTKISDIGISTLVPGSEYTIDDSSDLIVWTGSLYISTNHPFLRSEHSIGRAITASNLYLYG